MGGGLLVLLRRRARQRRSGSGLERLAGVAREPARRLPHLLKTATGGTKAAADQAKAAGRRAEQAAPDRAQLARAGGTAARGAQVIRHAIPTLNRPRPFARRSLFTRVSRTARAQRAFRDAGGMVRRAAGGATEAGRKTADAAEAWRNAASDFKLAPRDAAWLLVVSAATRRGAQAVQQARDAHRLPIQCAVDLAVPLEVAYDEWMRLERLPEGIHTVTEIDRGNDGVLCGEIHHLGTSRQWEAEVREERDCESFAWRSSRGSDCAGLVTFHRLAERLTRLELQLDVIAQRPSEAAELTFHLAAHRAETELRRFKARLEVISPDDYDSHDTKEE